MTTSDGSRPGSDWTSARSSKIVVGIFVGGQSRRMGVPKGLLEAPQGAETLIARAWRVVEEALPQASRYLVGHQPIYDQWALASLPDEVPGCGPLGGLVSLLSRAREVGAAQVIAIACDMPYFEPALIERLAREQPGEAILAPFVEGRYQPLFARYDATLLDPFRVALEQRRLALQPLLRQQGAAFLSLSAGETLQLRDWDRPEDVERR